MDIWVGMVSLSSKTGAAQHEQCFEGGIYHTLTVLSLPESGQVRIKRTECSRVNGDAEREEPSAAEEAHVRPLLTQGLCGESDAVGDFDGERCRCLDVF